MLGKLTTVSVDKPLYKSESISMFTTRSCLSISSGVRPQGSGRRCRLDHDKQPMVVITGPSIANQSWRVMNSSLHGPPPILGA